MNDHTRVYDEYICTEFAPFVSSQLATVWRADHFERIQQVLFADNYYKTGQNPKSRPKSKSTKHILTWLQEQSRLRQPLLTHSQKFAASTSRSPRGMEHVSKDQLMKGREFMGKVERLIGDLSLHWRLRDVITRRFCTFLLREKILRPYTPNCLDNSSYFDERQYYFWNRKPDTGTQAKCTIPSFPNRVHNLDEIAMTQMRALIKSQRELIEQFKQERSQQEDSNDEDQKQSFHSLQLSESRSSRKRETVTSQPKFQTILPIKNKSTPNTPKEKEIYYDVNRSNSDTNKPSTSSDHKTETIVSPIQANDDKNRTMKVSFNTSRMFANTSKPPENNHLSTPRGFVSDSEAHTKSVTKPCTAPCSNNPDCGFLCQIRKNLSLGQQSLITTAFGLKSYLFKGGSNQSVEILDANPTGSPNWEEKVKRPPRYNYKMARRRNRMRMKRKMESPSEMESDTLSDESTDKLTRINTGAVDQETTNDMVSEEKNISQEKQSKISDIKDTDSFPKEETSNENPGSMNTEKKMDLNDTKTELSRKMAETLCENQGNKDALEETNIGEVTDDNLNGNPGSTGNDLGDNDNINNENETSTVDLKDMKTVNVLNDIGGLQSTEMLTSNQKSDEENDKKSNEENYLETINKAMSDMVINEELPNSDLINTTNGNDLETTGNEESTNIENIILA